MMEKVYSVDDVADWFLNKKEMTPKKLQKLVYYAYAWTLTLFNDSADKLNTKLFNEKIRAWVHGPVVGKLYHEYEDYGYNLIPRNTTRPKFTSDVEDILDQVWQLYGKYTANELESLTHQETPWQNARKGLTPLETGHNVILDKDIYEYFIQKLNND